MILTQSLIGGWDKMSLAPAYTNLSICAFLFLICVVEVVVMKMTTSNSIFGRPSDHPDYDDSSEYEEDIYYEDLRNNFGQLARRRMRQRQRQQRLREEMLQHFRLQQQEQQQPPQQQQQQQPQQSYNSFV